MQCVYILVCKEKKLLIVLMSSVMCLHFSMQEIYINELVNATCHVFALTVNVLTIV